MAYQLHTMSREAQRHYDNMSPPEPSEIDIDEAAAELLKDRNVRREITANDLAFSMSGDWFTECTDALLQLDIQHPHDLLGSQLLVDLYQLAKEARAAAMEVARERVEDAA